MDIEEKTQLFLGFLPDDTVDAIAEQTLQMVFEMAFSTYIATLSGCMNWPKGFRSELTIGTQVDYI